MAFRANEIALENKQKAERFLLSNLMDLTEIERQKSRTYLHKVINELGPVVDTYPIWHPLIVDKSKWQFYNTPHRETGYNKLDHTIFFMNGFITCPYNAASNFGQDVIDAVNAFPPIHGVTITADRAPVTLYNSDTTAIIVKCIWHSKSIKSTTLPLSEIMPKVINTAVEINKLKHASFSLIDMEPYLLGQPCGKRSSLFVDQNTGLAIKKIWQTLIDSEMI